MDEEGNLSLEKLSEAVREDTILVSAMYVNNELGAVLPVEEMGRIIKEKNPDAFFHVDAIQAYGKYRIFPIIGTVVMTGGLILLSTMGVGTSSFTSACWMIVLGAGMGFLMQITMLVAQNSVELKDMGVASSTATLFRTIGGSFGVALFGALFNNRVKDTMGQLLAGKPLPPGGAKDPGQTSPAELRKMPDYIQDAYHHAVSNGMHTVFLWGAGVAVIAIAAAVFLREVPLRGTGKGEKPAEASLEAAAV